MASIRGVAEIVLNARDLTTMVDFYRRVMGFTLHSQFPSVDPTIVFLTITELDSPLGQTHPQMLVLIDPARHPSAKGKFDPPSPHPFSLNHLAFEIDESAYDDEIARLIALGVDASPFGFPHIRAKAIFFQDPEGNRLELICHDPSINSEEAAQALIDIEAQLRDETR